MATFTLQRSCKIQPIEYQGSKKYDNQFPSLSQGKPRPQQTWGPNLSTGKPSYNLKLVTAKKFQSKVSTIECSYCHEQGHHIKNCQKASDATARKQNTKQSKRQQYSQLKKSRAVERLRQQVIDSQQYCQISPENPPISKISNPNGPPHTILEVTKWKNESTCDDTIDQITLKKQIQEKEDLMKTLTRWADKCDLQEEIDELDEQLK